MDKVKRFIRYHEVIMCVLSFIYRLVTFNRIKGRKGLKLINKGAFLSRSKIVNRGSNNSIEIGKGCRLRKLSIRLYGDNNKIMISNDCEGMDMDFWVEGGSVVWIGHNSHFMPGLHIACIEGRTVRIGERCLFSSGITFRTGDSHSILSACGKRINIAADITVGNHVWIGQDVVLLKGADIGDEAIVGTRSVVTGKRFEGGVILAGIPAKIIKEHVTWDHRLL